MEKTWKHFEMGIYDKVNKLPAGMMIVPVLVGAIVNTIAPQLLLIGDPFTSTFYKEGLMSLIGLMLFYTGTQCQFNQFGSMVKHGMPLVLFKLACFILLGSICIQCMPIEGIFGIPSIAFITCFISCNSALYLSLMDVYGDGMDQSNFGLLTIIGMPNIALLVIGSSQTSGFLSILAMVLPFMIGVAITAIDKNFKNMFSSGSHCIVPVAGFAFGTNIQLVNLFRSLGTGLLLTVITTTISMVLIYFFEKIVLQRQGFVGIATCGVSGVSLSLPYLASLSNPVFNNYVSVATAQCAVALTMTTFAIPYLTKWCYTQKNNDKL